MSGLFGGGAPKQPAAGSVVAPDDSGGDGGSASIVATPPASQVGDTQGSSNSAAAAAAQQQPLNHISALTPPTAVDQSVKDAATIARVAAAKAMGRNSTIATSGQGVSGLATVTKKTLLGG